MGPQRTDIPALVKDTRATMAALQTTASEFNKTAQEATRAATTTANAVSALGSSVLAPGGVLDQVSQGSAALAQSAQALNTTVLPRLGRASDDTAKSARNIDRVFGNLGDNPQSLIYGNGSATPGPGEPGFVAPTPASATR
jgi:phospholipid/cholesterol/gamma-HCH transport system substrate-binding protein